MCRMSLTSKRHLGGNLCSCNHHFYLHFILKWAQAQRRQHCFWSLCTYVYFLCMLQFSLALKSVQRFLWIPWTLLLYRYFWNPVMLLIKLISGEMVHQLVFQHRRSFPVFFKIAPGFFFNEFKFNQTSYFFFYSNLNISYTVSTPILIRHILIIYLPLFTF